VLNRFAARAPCPVLAEVGALPLFIAETIQTRSHHKCVRPQVNPLRPILVEWPRTQRAREPVLQWSIDPSSGAVDHVVGLMPVYPAR
jgi:hypothetical protein